MRYYVTIEGRTLEIDVGGHEIKVDGERVIAEIHAVPGSSIHHLTIDAKVHRMVARKGQGRGAWRISLDGRPVDVQVQDSHTRAILELTGHDAAQVSKSLIAPMPGLVVRLAVEVGQTVAAGQGVIVVEAMKMENELKAPAAGVVREIAVAPGQAVEKGTMLVAIE